MLKLLGFDFGASSGRGMLGQFDGERLTLSEIHRFLNEPVRINGSLFWDILHLFNELKKGILKCKSAGDNDIASIGIDTWGVDFGLLDSSGKLISNLYHYRDANTQGMMEKAFGMLSAREIYSRTGIQFQAFNTLFQLLSIVRQRPWVLDNAKTMLFTPDLLRYFLTGEKSTEYTIASTSQMLNAQDHTWDSYLISSLGIPHHMLTDIVNPGTITGKLSQDIASELNIGTAPVVAVAEHDTASAVMSVPAVGHNYAYLSSGTWSLLGIECSNPITSKDAYRMNYTNEGGFNGTIRFLKNIMGLWIIQECKRAWEVTNPSLSFKDMEEAAKGAQAFSAFIDPDDITFYQPGNMPEKIQAFCEKSGQSVPRSIPEITRCIIESLALKYRAAMEGLEQVAGYAISTLHIVGGGSQNALLSQFTANAINRPVITGPAEATALGNVVCQLIALGKIDNLSQGREIIIKSFPTGQYLPHDAESWDAAYEKFVKICAGNNVQV